MVSPFQSARILSSRAGRGALLARGEQPGASSGKTRLVRRRAGRGQPAQDVAPLPIALGADVISGGEGGRVLAQQRGDLLGAPDIEAPFLALGIGVERGGESLADLHLAHQPGEGLLRAGGVDRRRRLGVAEREQFEDLRVVVEHLLEVRHEPDGVGRIAREAAAEMIVDAARAQRVEQPAHRGAQTRDRRDGRTRSRKSGRSARWETSARRAGRQLSRSTRRSRASRGLRQIAWRQIGARLRRGELGQMGDERRAALIEPGALARATPHRPRPAPAGTRAGPSAASAANRCRRETARPRG